MGFVCYFLALVTRIKKHPKSTTSSISRFGVVWFGVLVWRQQPEMTEGPLPNLPRPQTLQRNKQVIKPKLKWKYSYICEMYHSSGKKYSSLRGNWKVILPFFLSTVITSFWSKACLSGEGFTKQQKVRTVVMSRRNPFLPIPTPCGTFFAFIFFLLKMDLS